MNRSLADRRRQQPFRVGIGVLALLVLLLKTTSIVAIASSPDENAGSASPTQPRSAASPKTETPAATIPFEVVGTGLRHPYGLAVQPETGIVFVAESGAGRVVRMVDGKTEEVIVGFPTEPYAAAPQYNIGPLGLFFLDKDTLVVGDGGSKDGEEFARVFAVPMTGTAAIKFEEAKQKLGPLAASEPLPAEGNFFGIAATKTSLFVACQGANSRGQVAKADINDGKLGELKRFLGGKDSPEVASPLAVAIGPNGELVVGQSGERTVASDSRLTFYNPNSGKLLLNLQTGLHDLSSLAYHPANKQLYALDIASLKPEDGGLFRLARSTKEAQQTIRPIKLLKLDQPTAMAFGKSGELYIATLGAPTGDGAATNPPTGTVIKIPQGL